MGAMEEMSLRRATVADGKTVADHRRAMFRDMGYQDEAALDYMPAKFLPWVEMKMASGDYLAWLALAGNAVVAGAHLVLLYRRAPHLLPHPRPPTISTLPPPSPH